MTYSIRERLVRALVERLNTISVENGYATSPPDGWAQRWTIAGIPVPVAPEFAVALVWRGEENVQEESQGVHRCMLSIVIEVAVSTDNPDIDTDLDQYLTDVEQCVMADEEFGGLATQVFLRGSSLEITEEEKDEHRGEVRFEIQYDRLRADPRSAPWSS